MLVAHGVELSDQSRSKSRDDDPKKVGTRPAGTYGMVRNDFASPFSVKLLKLFN